MIFSAALLLTAVCGANAQVYISDNEEETELIATTVADSLATDSLVMDSVPVLPLPGVFFIPQVYVGYALTDTLSITPEEAPVPGTTLGSQAMQWIQRENRMSKFITSTRQRHAIYHPENVRYNIKDLPKAPDVVMVTVDDPTKATVSIGDLSADINAQVEKVEINRQHWLNKLGINFQLSQAYISPNWYQGGTSSLNLVADFTYSSNLNTKYHPNLLFENFFQWRTALASAPDDQYRNYNITENRLQINSKFGYKASSKWYYTITGVFKTPIFNSYKSNSKTLTGSFLSPGELNLGLGMTFNTANRNKTLTFNATIAPLSYNLKTVINKNMNPVSQGLEEGRKTKNSVGSNVDAVLNWKLSYNINWRSRLFFFTNYEYSQADWQNQFQFVINRFLTTNLNIDMRYDTSIKSANRDKEWGLLQLRELITIGFTYNITH